MIPLFKFLIITIFTSLIVTAAPVGICLHAYSPEAPAEKIECFEFEKVERAGADYRFFPQSDKSVMVTAYRFRGTIPYKPELAPIHPEFGKLLKLYEETARATPSTRRFLNPKILLMRGQAATVAKQLEDVAKLPTITTADGTQLIGCTMSKIDDGFAIIRHQDGISKVSLKELDVTEKKALNSTTGEWSLDDPSVTPKDSTGTFAKIVFKNGLLLKKAKFKEVADGNLVFMADGKSVSVPADQFPGELSVLGEEVVKSLMPVKEEAYPEPTVASSGGTDPTAVAVQSKRANVPVPATKRPNNDFGSGFVLPGDEASGGGFVLPGDEAPNEQALDKMPAKNHDLQNFKAMLEHEVRANRLKDKLKEAGEYNEKTAAAAGMTAISDTDWSECSPELLQVSDSAKNAINLYIEDKVTTKEVLSELEPFHVLTSNLAERFAKDMSYVTMVAQIVEDVRERISKEDDYALSSNKANPETRVLENAPPEPRQKTPANDKVKTSSNDSPAIKQSEKVIRWFRELPKDRLYGSVAASALIFLYYFVKRRSKDSKTSNQTNPNLQHPENSQREEIKFPCHHCGVNISAEADTAGTSANCPTCGQDLVVPTAPKEVGDDSHQSVSPPTPINLPPVPAGQKVIHQKSKNLLKSGIIVLVAIATVAAVTSKNGKADTRVSESAPRQAAHQKQKTNKAGYDAYMTGYNDPEQGDVAEAMIDRFSGGDRQAALLMILGAEDRRKGLTIRFFVAE